MPLASFGFLACVVPLAGFGCVRGCLDDLGVDDRGGRLGGAAGLLADLAAQQVVDLPGGAVFLPFGVVVEDCLAWREIVRQVLPCDAGAVT
jgi:hypothetical protein